MKKASAAAAAASNQKAMKKENNVKRTASEVIKNIVAPVKEDTNKLSAEDLGLISMISTRLHDLYHTDDEENVLGFC